jgi:oligopeptide transport system substrate-binding protein
MLGLGKYFFTFVCLSFLFSCEKSPSQVVQKPQILQVGLSQLPKSLDPRKVKDSTSSMLARMLFEGLTRIGPEGEIVPSLADNIEVSSDRRTYTFHIKDAYWSDGKPITAYDFVNSWMTALDPEFESPLSHYLFVIDHAKDAKGGDISLDQIGAFAVDDKTLLVHLENPLPYFLEMVAHPVFFPVSTKAGAKPSSFDLGKGFVTSGPFALKALKENQWVRFEKRASYWDADLVALETIDLKLLSPTEAIDKFKKGELDWIENSNDYREGLPITAMQQQKSHTHWLRFNPLIFPFNEQKLRKVFSLAMGSYVKDTSVNASSQKHKIDVDQFVAQKLLEEFLEENNMPLEQLPKVSLLVKDTEEEKQVANFAKQQWEDSLGVEVDITIVSALDFEESERDLEYHIATQTISAPTHHPLYFLDLLEEKFGDSFTSFVSSSKLENIRKLSQENILNPNSKNLVEIAQEIFDESIPFIPVHIKTTSTMKNASLKNIVMTNQGEVEFRWASIQ